MGQRFDEAERKLLDAVADLRREHAVTENDEWLARSSVRAIWYAAMQLIERVHVLEKHDHEDHHGNCIHCEPMRQELKSANGGKEAWR